MKRDVNWIQSIVYLGRLSCSWALRLRSHVDLHETQTTFGRPGLTKAPKTHQTHHSQSKEQISKTLDRFDCQASPGLTWAETQENAEKTQPTSWATCRTPETHLFLQRNTCSRLRGTYKTLAQTVLFNCCLRECQTSTTGPLQRKVQLILEWEFNPQGSLRSGICPSDTREKATCFLQKQSFWASYFKIWQGLHLTSCPGYKRCLQYSFKPVLPL